MVARRIVHFLLHVPKCAGTTVEEHFRAALGDGFLLAPRWHNPLRAAIGNRYSMAADDPRLPSVRMITGHSMGASLKRHFPGAEIRQSVLLRDPVSYHLSLYNYRAMRHGTGTGPKPPQFDAWYARQRRDPISRFLLNHYFEFGVPALYRFSSLTRLNYLEQRLRDFWFVGSFRHADTMIAGISGELGVDGLAQRQNETSVDAVTEASLGDEICKRIVAENAVDQALWSRWANRGWNVENRNPHGPPPALPQANQMRYLRSDIATLVRRMAVQ